MGTTITLTPRDVLRAQEFGEPAGDLSTLMEE